VGNEDFIWVFVICRSLRRAVRSYGGASSDSMTVTASGVGLVVVSV
jgi:hypothetical protein